VISFSFFLFYSLLFLLFFSFGRLLIKLGNVVVVTQFFLLKRVVGWTRRRRRRRRRDGRKKGEERRLKPYLVSLFNPFFFTCSLSTRDPFFFVLVSSGAVTFLFLFWAKEGARKEGRKGDKMREQGDGEENGTR